MGQQTAACGVRAATSAQQRTSRGASGCLRRFLACASVLGGGASAPSPDARAAAGGGHSGAALLLFCVWQ
eukprot:13556419-Alexandrium_andersonii.AAC.1